MSGNGISLNVGGTTVALPSSITIGDVTTFVKDVRAEANHTKDPAIAKILDQLATDLTNALGQQGLTKAGHGGKSWLEAIAEAMGKALGDLAQQIVNDTNQLQNLTGSGSAQQFQEVMADFQAKSQLFSMLANAFSTSIKSIGDGMTTMAQKG